MQLKFRLFFMLFVIALLSPIAGNVQAAGKNVVMETTHGAITIQLYDHKAPITVANFRQYVRDGFYDGLIFHRVMPDFVIQGGGFAPGMKKRAPGPEIKNEADNGLKNKRGTLSMARMQGKDTASSQFFINLKDNRQLDHQGRAHFGYAVFGKVIEGMEVVDRIAHAPTTTVGFYQNVPIRDMVIIRAYEK